jgi:hypothetical protein
MFPPIQLLQYLVPVNTIIAAFNSSQYNYCSILVQEVPDNPLRYVKYSIILVLDDNDILGIEGRPTQGLNETHSDGYIM